MEVEETLDLKDIFLIIKKHFFTIVLCMFIGLGLAGALTFFVITPKYSSQAQLVVTLPQTENTNSNDVNVNLQMINTYKNLIKSDLILNKVKNQMESNYNIKLSVKEINDAIDVVQNENSLMFSLVANSDNALTAERLANTTASIFKDTVKDVLGESVDKISIISNATVQNTPVSPNHMRNLAIGVLAGIIVGVGLSFAFELLDRTVKSSKFVRDELELTILGTIPQLSAKELQDNTRKVARIPQVQSSAARTASESAASQRRSRSRV